MANGDPIQITHSDDIPRDLPLGMYDLFALHIAVSKSKKTFFTTIDSPFRTHKNQCGDDHQILLPSNSNTVTKKRALLDLYSDNQRGEKALYLPAPVVLKAIQR